MTTKEIISLIVIAITFLNCAYYVCTVIRKEIRPHAFSWVIWGVVQLIGSVALLAKGAGVGAWPLVFGGVICFFVAALALFYHGERNITRSDWAAFLGALSAIPLWLITNDPLSATLVVSLIDGVGIYPTFRKSWHDPFEENLFLFATATLNYTLTLFALESYSPTTYIYPVSMAITHGALSIMLFWRRRVLKRASA